MPDPVLIKACAEIEEILKKNDIAGIIWLQSKTHGHFLHRINPTWSCVTLVDDFLRVKCKTADFPSQEAAKECLEKSVGMLAGFADNAEHTRNQMFEVLKVIGKSVSISHISTLEKPPEGDETDPVNPCE